jgi:hypothetical protein
VDPPVLVTPLDVSEPESVCIVVVPDSELLDVAVPLVSALVGVVGPVIVMSSVVTLDDVVAVAASAVDEEPQLADA